MPPLKNLKHEKFAQEVIRKDNPTNAYKEAYQLTNYDSAKVNASKLLTNPNVRERCIELLNQQGLDINHLNTRLNKWVNDDLEPNVSMKAIETGYKLHGLLGEERNNINAESVEIQIVNLTKKD